MAVVVDFSFAHAQVTPNALRRVPGAVGGIGYAGCNDRTKCITKTELQALLAAGFQVGLVVENGAEDALQGAAVGTAQGRAILADAKDLGYDWRNSVLFGGADFNETTPGQYAATLAYMEAFAAVVPVPGYYGDSDSIDYLHAHHPEWIFWQSDSRSYSPRNPTPNAHLWQQFNDPRAGALSSAVDINNLLKPLPLMGAEMNPADFWETFKAKLWNGSSPSPWSVLSSVHQTVHNIATVTNSVASGVANTVTRLAAVQQAQAAQGTQLAAIAADVAALKANGGVTVQPTDVPAVLHIQGSTS